MKLHPIGIIHSPFARATGTPIQPSLAKGASGSVEVFEEFVPGLRDLAGFERIWLLYWFDRAAFGQSALLVKPYLDNTPRGVFATRAPARPNPIGLSAVRLRKIRGNTLTICDVDILNGTPLLDIKPYVPQFDSFSAARIGWLKGVMAKGIVADNRFEKKAR
ncbi:MAG: tRNA (N6-threonylcarbamoyladenosine(37)-N6)-methyltransferase TrmO [Terriglobia bacterium]